MWFSRIWISNRYVSYGFRRVNHCNRSHKVESVGYLAVVTKVGSESNEGAEGTGRCWVSIASRQCSRCDRI